MQPALSKALTSLAREKPSAEKCEAITYLANFLLTNNPNKPKIVTPEEWDPSMEEEDDEAEFAHAQLALTQEQAALEEARLAAAEQERLMAAAAAQQAAAAKAASAGGAPAAVAGEGAAGVELVAGPDGSLDLQVDLNDTFLNQVSEPYRSGISATP